MSAAAIQPFKQLDPDTEDALRASIKRFGVVIPIVLDGNGRIIDGHHRARIARELNVPCPQIKRVVRNDDDANALAYTLNADRRHMTVEQRREIVAELHAQGHSLRAIAGVVKVSHVTVKNDVEQAGVNPLTPGENSSANGEADAGAGSDVDEQDQPSAPSPAPNPATHSTGRDGKSYRRTPKNPSRTQDALAERREAIKRMVGENFTSRQITQKLGISRAALNADLKLLGIDSVPADASIGKTRLIDPDVVMENTVQMAVDLFNVDHVINFAELDGDHLAGWVSSLSEVRTSLTTLINKLKKELTRDRE